MVITILLAALGVAAVLALAYLIGSRAARTSAAAADERIPQLLDTPAAVRFLSIEPLLWPVDLTRIAAFKSPPWPEPLDGTPWLDVLRGVGARPSPMTGVLIETHIDRHIDWVIVGGESGPGARPMNPRWARSIRDQCVEAQVPFHFKQWGHWLGIEGRDVGDRTAYDPQFSIGLLGRLKRWEDDGLCARGPGANESAISFLKPGFFSAPVGKKKAGRLLEGRTWDEMPASPAAAL